MICTGKLRKSPRWCEENVNRFGNGTAAVPLETYKTRALAPEAWLSLPNHL